MIILTNNVLSKPNGKRIGPRRNVQYSAVLRGDVQYSAILRGDVQYSAIMCPPDQFIQPEVHHLLPPSPSLFRRSKAEMETLDLAL